MEIKPKVIEVPYGIKYMSEWNEYDFPKGHVIVDKGVTGCGYTEYCLRNDLNIILCSPRKLLLENKLEQHAGEDNIFYLKNEATDYDGAKSLVDQVKDHVLKYQGFSAINRKPVKILVTYDSTKYVIEALKSLHMLHHFYPVVDEFQSIFLDSYFKPEVEFDFVNYLQECPNVLYLSATPMLNEYLKDIPEFQNLPFYQLDWSKTGIVESIVVKRKFSKTLVGECRDIIQRYKSGNFEIKITSDNKLVYSREAVFYFNSIGDITQIIKKEKLRPEEVNIICSNTPDNVSKMKKLTKDFKEENPEIKLSEEFKIGKIPLKGQPNKMFTFCSKTAYIGADFYSDNASSYVFADPNISCLALDISLDLPQIAGRQRDRENPFKNEITVVYRTIRKKEIVNRKEFDEKQNFRRRETYNLLEFYKKGTPDQQKAFIKKIRDGIKVSQYVDDYVSISSKTGEPVYNYFIEIANRRAWDVSQRDYQDKISVTRALEDVASKLEEYRNEIEMVVSDFLNNHFYSTGIFEKRMKMYCEFMDKHSRDYCQELQDLIYFKIKDERFRIYYNFFGTQGCKSVGYIDSKLKSEMMDYSREFDLPSAIYNKFCLGKSYTLKEIKFILGNIYRDLGISRKPKATDLEKYYKLTRTRLIRDGKESGGFKLHCLI